MNESDNNKSALEVAQKFDRELRRSLNTLQGYMHALEEETLTKKQLDYVTGLQNEIDRMTRKVRAFGKVIDPKVDLVSETSSVFNTHETFEVLIAILKVDFPLIKYTLNKDPKISPQNFGDSNHITDMIHGISVLLLQHESTALSIILHLSQITAGTQFIDINIEAKNCSLSQKTLMNCLSENQRAVVSKSKFVSSLSLELSRKLIRLRGIEPEIEKIDEHTIRIGLYDQWKAAYDYEPKSIDQLSHEVQKKYHILIVEDDKLNQMVTQMMIQNFGWTSDIAENGIEALELYDPKKHNCVLMDIELPRMDGYECTTELRKRYGNNFPIIALSANSEGQKTEFYSIRGLNDYLLKPVKKDILHSKIMQAEFINQKV